MIHNKTCETCDYSCPGHLLTDTCDSWEHVIWSVDVPDDVIAQILGEPTSEDLQSLFDEISRIEGFEE